MYYDPNDDFMKYTQAGYTTEEEDENYNPEGAIAGCMLVGAFMAVVFIVVCVVIAIIS